MIHIWPRRRHRHEQPPIRPDSWKLSTCDASCVFSFCSLTEKSTESCKLCVESRGARGCKELGRFHFWDGVKRLDLPSFPKQSMNRTRYLKQWFSRHWPQTLGSEYNGHWETKQDQPHPFNPGERGAGTQLREWDFRQGPEHCLEEEESEMGLWGYLGS